MRLNELYKSSGQKDAGVIQAIDNQKHDTAKQSNREVKDHKKANGGLRLRFRQFGRMNKIYD
jgi:hypothetical protein